MTRRRYAVAGTGNRARMYLGALAGEHRADGELVALCEPNPTRAAHYSTLHEFSVPRYDPDDLEQLIADHQVDRVVVTSPDHTHADMVSRALRAGADVVVEKPLTTTAAGIAEITDAVQETGRDLVTTFNYRYAPRNSELRRVLAAGEIGQVLSVHFEWVLDTSHGADYFRRWHREKARSGGLLVHKSSHHFDLVNWWIGAVPVRVYAAGGLMFYGPDGAGASGAGPRPDRGSSGAANDPWSLDLRSDPRLQALYLDAEHHDGYRRDQDPFAPGITIEDDLAVMVHYDSGAMLTYSLTAHGPWEGYRVVVNGSAGRAELDVVERSYVPLETGGRVVDPSATEVDEIDGVRPVGGRLVVQRHWERAREVEIPRGTGGHGGGDAILLQDVFRPGQRPDPLGQRAGALDGVRAVAVGIAGNRSLETGDAVRIGDLGVELQ
ncbi:Gfo/Idh/MocA family protein [Ruania rhizosphaerae]|uniref:Gfo/Idh/MocA family protein n=1 Tax=Ruania rhizosphaerae TaxID=1840413 RepID=UPI00135C408C|nr:Gfo/Idh/MocA family oxidoreductase [Ruania rhizosphaerae]